MIGMVSDCIELNGGAPQGLAIGPLLFNLYVSDLPYQFTEIAQIVQCTDDCVPYNSNGESESALNSLEEIIIRLEKRFSCNLLNLNDIKTEFIIFSREMINVSRTLEQMQ